MLSILTECLCLYVPKPVGLREVSEFYLSKQIAKNSLIDLALAEPCFPFPLPGSHGTQRKLSLSTDDAARSPSRRA